MRISGLKQQVSRPSRYSVYIDGRYALSLSNDAILVAGLVVGRELDKAGLEKLKQLAAGDTAYTNALRFVTIRPRSEWELRSYFGRKRIDKGVASEVIVRLQALRLIDDQAFARSWVASRRALKAISKRRLQQELRQKHVSLSIIDMVLSEDETDERQVLAELIERKRKITRYRDDLKLMQYLSRQGYDYDMVKAALAEMKD
jgi:regulatory protein